jgi:hypothetical protein
MAAPFCGDGNVDPGEECDPVGSLSCPDPGSPNGALVACETDCQCPHATTTTTEAPPTTTTEAPTTTTSEAPTTTTTTTMAGPVCGNSVVEPGEECDPVGSLSCADPGSPTGALIACGPGCQCPVVLAE